MGTVKYSISLSNTGKHGWLHLALDLSRAIGNSWCNDSYHVNFAFNCRSDLRQTVRQHRILGNALSSGQSLFGSIFLLPLFYFAGAKIFRRRIGDVFDVFTMCTVTTLLFARIACIFSGCCYGMLLPGSESVRWPTRELELVFYIILLIVLYRKIAVSLIKEKYGRFI